MTDARFPERWLNDRRVLRLPDDAFRLFALGLMWAVANRTDGVLYDDDLTMIPGVDPGQAPRIAKDGLWVREADRWCIADFDATQTSAAKLEAAATARRASDRARQARHRDKSRDSHVPNPRDNTRTGQARLGSSTGVDLKNRTKGNQQQPPARENGSGPDADFGFDPAGAS
jgi:hypothetical protein